MICILCIFVEKQYGLKSDFQKRHNLTYICQNAQIYKFKNLYQKLTFYIFHVVRFGVLNGFVLIVN